MRQGANYHKLSCRLNFSEITTVALLWIHCTCIRILYKDSWKYIWGPKSSGGLYYNGAKVCHWHSIRNYHPSEVRLAVRCRCTRVHVYCMHDRPKQSKSENIREDWLWTMTILWMNYSPKIYSYQIALDLHTYKCIL